MQRGENPVAMTRYLPMSDRDNTIADLKTADLQ